MNSYATIMEKLVSFANESDLIQAMLIFSEASSSAAAFLDYNNPITAETYAMEQIAKLTSQLTITN
jgi:hypothetical protein